MTDRETSHQPDDVDLLEELSKGEDEFDVDLMACGCRLVMVKGVEWSIYDIIRLYDLRDDQLISLVGALVDEANIAGERLHYLADQVAKGEIRELDGTGSVDVTHGDLTQTQA